MKLFDRKRLITKPLSERIHNLCISDISQRERNENPELLEKFKPIARHVVNAKRNNSEVILMIGAHVLRSGVQTYIIDLMKRGYLSCIAMNGAGVIHDFELALIGATTESVARYIQQGQFGLWQETGVLNDIINQSYKDDDKKGMGEAIGKTISEGNFPYKDFSILAAGYRLQIPVTVHVGIGYDIIHEHSNCDGAATGALSYNDFLKFASVVQNLEFGMIMNFGSAVMAPEVFLKSLSMARNIAKQQESTIKHFTSVVCDLHDIPESCTAEPSKDSPAYYFRPWKTMLVRTVADGGQSYYIKGRHSETMLALWTAINEIEK